MTSTHDQLFSVDPKRPYVYHGCSFPQRSVPHAAIRGAALAVGAAMYQKGIIGHAGVDFVSFYDDFNQRQRLWAVDLNLGMTRSNVVFTLTDFLLRGKVETASGEYMVKPLSMTELPSAILDKSDASSSAGDDDASVLSEDTLPPEGRSYVALDCLYHPNLGAMQYGSFFNLCRLHGVSFDLQQRTGTAFMLTDSLTAGIIGLIGVGKESEDAYKMVHKSLRFIESQVGSLRQPTEFDSEKSNFSEISTMIKDKVAEFRPVVAGGKHHK
jgi:IQ domain-containing protein H